MCESVGGGGNLYEVGMGYYGNILLKNNAGAGEAEIEGLIYWEGVRATDRTLNFIGCLEFAIDDFFTRNLNRVENVNDNTVIFFIIEESKETIVRFFTRNCKSIVILFCFNTISI